MPSYTNLKLENKNKIGIIKTEDHSPCRYAEPGVCGVRECVWRDIAMRKKYLDVKEYLLNQIQSGAYKEDVPIPPERELAASLGVNRMTLRKAVEELMYEGFLIRKKGSGTFLTKTKVGKEDLIRASSGEENSEISIISCKLCMEGHYGFKVLNLPRDEGRAYWRLRRIRMMNMIRYAYEDIYFNQEVFPKVDESYYHMGLYQMIREKSGLQADVYITETAEALLCLHNTAVLLNVKVDSPILQIKSTFESEGKNILFCRSYHPGDSYSYHALKRKIFEDKPLN